MQSHLENRQLAARSLNPERSLILVHTNGFQSVADFISIRDFVCEEFPDIEVFIAENDSRCSATRRSAARRPTLVFSPVSLKTFKPDRGKVYEGRAMSKMRQVERLVSAGISVPRTALLGPETKLDPSDWGEFVILKPSSPSFQSKGQGISLLCTEDVRYIPPEEYPSDHPGRYSPMLVQKYIHTGSAISNIRVLTLFGEPLYALQSWSKVETVELIPESVRTKKQIVAHQLVPPEEKTVKLTFDEDVLALAKAVYAACPEAALQGCDLLRDSTSGALYVLEFNPGGNTWHFSSTRMLEARQRLDEFGEEFAAKRKAQFDAFRTAARVLAERTRLEAV
jgi:hypothetical protein